MHVFTDDEVRQAFDAGIPIYFDTMVFRNLWKLHSNPRKNLLGRFGIWRAVSISRTKFR